MNNIRTSELSRCKVLSSSVPLLGCFWHTMYCMSQCTGQQLCFTFRRSQFESQPADWLFWQYSSWFSLVSQGKCWDSTFNKPWLLPPTSLPIHYL